MNSQNRNYGGSGGTIILANTINQNRSKVNNQKLLKSLTENYTVFSGWKRENTFVVSHRIYLFFHNKSVSDAANSKT